MEEPEPEAAPGDVDGKVEEDKPLEEPEPEVVPGNVDDKVEEDMSLEENEQDAVSSEKIKVDYKKKDDEFGEESGKGNPQEIKKQLFRKTRIQTN